MHRTLVIGSRGSKLALTQADLIRAQMTALVPDLTTRIEIIKTTGDVKHEPLSVIGGKGVFTKELEDALLEGRIDVAVHSLKDLPSIIPEGLTIAAICEREDPRDALVVREGACCRSIQELPRGAVVGTSSQRRLAQLKHARPDILVKDLRGNVDTRLRKLQTGEYDALILAAAGLRRLGLEERISLSIPIEEMVPAVGQGALAVETRTDDDYANDVVNGLNHEATRQACIAERAFLRELGGGCQLPIAAHGLVHDAEITIFGMVASPTGSEIVFNNLSGSSVHAEDLGIELARMLWNQGADGLLS